MRKLTLLLFTCALYANIPNNRIALVANGKEKVSSHLIEMIRNSPKVIAVDGGIHLCIAHDIPVDYLIGDLDSVDPKIVQNLTNVKVIKLDRAKDIVDLEAALLLAQEINAMATPCIFQSLGGRSDHHLNNLYLLFSYPESLICSDDVMICSERNRLSPKMKYKVPFYGKKSLRLSSPQSILPKQTENEEIFLLSPANPTIELATASGLTISLIPHKGPVHGIHTQGLKWNLNGESLDESFIGISNVALKEKVSIRITKGMLHCIIQKNLIDEEMIGLVDYSSTAKFTSD